MLISFSTLQYNDKDDKDNRDSPNIENDEDTRESKTSKSNFYVEKEGKHARNNDPNKLIFPI